MKTEAIEFILSGFPVQKADQLRAHISEYVPRADFVKVRCAKCQMEVWVGPRQNMLQIVTEAQVWCVICVLEHQKQSKRAGGEFSIASLGGESAKIVTDDGREIEASYEL